MKIVSDDSVTVTLNSSDRQNLARILNGYYLYRQGSVKEMSVEESDFCMELEKITLDGMGVLVKNRPSTMIKRI